MTKFYKHPKFGHVYGHELPTPQGRLAWPSLKEPKAPPPPKPGEQPGASRYEVTLLIDKGEGATQFLETISQMVTGMLERFNEGRGAKISISDCLKDGDTFDMEKYPYYKGKFVLVARNSSPDFKCYGSKKEIVGPETIVGGCIGKLVVTPLVTAHGVSYKLNAVQMIKDDGTRFGGGVKDFKSMLDGDEGTELPKAVSFGELLKTEEDVADVVLGNQEDVIPEAKIEAHKPLTPAEMRAQMSAKKKTSPGMADALRKL